MVEDGLFGPQTSDAGAHTTVISSSSSLVDSTYYQHDKYTDDCESSSPIKGHMQQSLQNKKSRNYKIQDLTVTPGA